MSLGDSTGIAVYLAVFIAAVIEGEILFIAAAMLVGQGSLDAVGVVIAGAAGASTGDHLWFYLLGGRLRRWLDRWPAIARRGHALAARVRRADTLMIFSIRFSPGLRLALTAACAYAHVPRLKFSLVNAAASVIWAAALLSLVAWIGPAVLGAVGISGWWSVIVPAVLVLAIVRVMTRAEPPRDAGDGQ